MKRNIVVLAVLALTVGACGGAPASQTDLEAFGNASHSWAGYHWARTGNPFSLSLGNDLSAIWQSPLTTAASDWSASTVLDTTVVAGLAKPRNCRPTAGRVEVCNATYGSTGWLGIAQVWASGTHITQGTVKLNDTYFNTASYNTAEWRNMVTCQEIGHTLGLDHQDTNFSNAPLGTCMDYTNDPTPNQHPNQHDYDELSSIYSHVDATTTLAATTAAAPHGASQDETWGNGVHADSRGRSDVFVRENGAGERVVTFVTWAN